MKKSDIKLGNVRINPGREHTHRGIIYPENAIVEGLTEEQIQMIEAAGTGKRTTEKPAPIEA